jgi:Na+-translocating ferredoxin:NAD+ oxidoreductase RNF subunit RnfB
MAVTIIVLVCIGLVLGILIYVVNVFIPNKVKGLEKTEEIAAILPGANCGACGNPGCFAYAQKLVEDKENMMKTPCNQILADGGALKRLEAALGITIDADAMSKKAVIHCNGSSPVVYDYTGVKTCKGAASLLKGYKQCPFECLGFGDCIDVCPQKAISINREKGIAVIDKEKCVGCGLCAVECPQNLIELVSARTKMALICNYQILRDISGREKCDSGCIHCRKCLRACEFEAITFDAVKGIPIFDNEKCTLCGKCIEVCPPQCLIDFSAAGKVPELAKA